MGQPEYRENPQTNQLKTRIRALAKEYLESLKSRRPHPSGEIAENQWEKHICHAPPMISYLNIVRRVRLESFSNWRFGNKFVTQSASATM